MMNERDIARTEATSSDSNEDWIRFRKLRNQETIKVRKDKKECLKNIFEKADVK